MLILSAGMMAYTGLQVMQHPRHVPAATQESAIGVPQPQTDGLSATTSRAQTSQEEQK